MKTPSEKQKFLEILEEVPIVSIACKRANIAKSTVYRWRRNKEFKAKMDECLSHGRDTVTDVVESKLIETARKGEPWAVKLWLENNCKRYVRPRPNNFFIDSSNQKKDDVVKVIYVDASEPTGIDEDLKMIEGINEVDKSDEMPNGTDSKLN